MAALPWDFRVVTQRPDEVTVAMSITDDVSFAGAPDKFNVGVTGIEATYSITLEGGARRARYANGAAQSRRQSRQLRILAVRDARPRF